MEPTHHDINNLVDICGIPSLEAEKWLRAYDCNTEKALNAFFENGGVLKVQNTSNGWDEDAFHSDRASGGSQHPPAFAVHAQDTLNPQIFNDNAPSRPPSRVSMKGLNQANGPAEHSTKTRHHHMTLAEKEDYDIQQAMSRSITENQMASQENGVITGKDPQFGPATREHYDTHQWTMTLPKNFPQDIVTSTDPPDRKRGLGNPAFFKPSRGGHRLPALMKILQTIPMAREALLCHGYTLPDYGYNDEWWDGVPIGISKPNDLEGDNNASQDEIVYETQRLIAFLDETERAYGSVDALAQLVSLRGSRDDLLPKIYLDSWVAAASDANVDHPSTAAFKTESVSINSEHREVDNHSHHFFDIPVSNTELDTARTLYEVMDNQFWGDCSDCNTDRHYLKKPGEILCFQLSHQKEQVPSTGVRVPSNLYLDRYLASSGDHIEQMLAMKKVVEQDIKAADEASERIMRYNSLASQGTFDAPTLIKKVVEHFENAGTGAGASVPKEGARIVDDLKTLADSVSNKLAALQDSKDRALERLKGISNWYTTAAEDPDQPPYYKYTLRGVSASSDTVYVFDRGLHMNSETDAWHWWKLSYTQGDAKPVSQMKVREVEVLKAAKDGSRTVLLVYASELAVNVPRIPLPSQLQNFVRADNLTFTAELERYGIPQASMLDNDDIVAKSYHSSDDGVEAVDISLNDSLEQSPLIKKTGSDDSGSSTRETAQLGSPLFGKSETATSQPQEMQETKRFSTKGPLFDYGCDTEMKDRLD